MAQIVRVQMVQDAENTAEYQAQHDTSGKVVPAREAGGWRKEKGEV